MVRQALNPELTYETLVTPPHGEFITDEQTEKQTDIVLI